MATKQTTIREFVMLLGTMSAGFDKQLLRFAHGVATDVRREAIRNGQRTFGMTARNNSRGKAIAPSRGKLVESIMLAVVGQLPGVTIGSPTVPYAAIHEFGGWVKPRNAKYLTIPQDPYFVGKRAREFDLSVVKTKSGKLFLVQKQTGIFAYLLRREPVRIPPRPYLRPAMELVAGSDRTKLNAEKLLGAFIK
jgi:phage gpG-like protein